MRAVIFACLAHYDIYRALNGAWPIGGIQYLFGEWMAFSFFICQMKYPPSPNSGSYYEDHVR